MKAQTYGHFEHLVLLDDERAGCAASYNRLAERAHGVWLFLLNDDDLLLPGCLSAHVEASGGVHVVYGRALVWGEDEAQFVGKHPHIPMTSMVHRDVWHAVKGFRPEWTMQEDRRFFEEAVRLGFRFVRIEDRPTWVYRQAHGGNKSRNLGVAS